jgi:Beta-propeller repeat.
MKKLLWFLALLMIVMPGCKQTPKRSAAARQSATKVPPPPLPSGLKYEPKVAPKTAAPTAVAPSYNPTDFAVVSAKVQSGNKIVLTWINGTPPFQTQSRPDVLSPWANFGPSTTQHSVTNPAPYGFTTAFFRVITTQGQPPGTLRWVTPALGSTFFDNASANGVVVDRASGESVTAGSFQGTINFGNGPRTASVSASDAFLARYGQQGNLAWVKQLGSNGNDSASGVAIDSQRNIVVAGHFQGSVNLGGTLLTNAGNTDIFLAKYSPSGVHQWSQRFGGPWEDLAVGVSVDASDAIVLTARFQSFNASFGTNSSGAVVLLSNGSQYYDIALAKYSSTGVNQWAKRWGGPNNDSPYAMALDRTGDVWITGSFSIATDLGGGVRTSTGTDDGFIAKYSGASGDYRWDRAMSASQVAIGRGIATDPNTGNAVITGTFKGTANFGGGTVTSGTGATLFLAGYGPTGTYLWAKTMGGEQLSAGDTGYGINIDTEGSLVFSGVYSSVWQPDANIGGSGYFVSGWSVSGNAQPVYRWCRRSTTLNNSAGLGVAFDASGHAFTAGYFGYTTDFGGITIVAPGGSTGSFIAQYVK